MVHVLGFGKEDTDVLKVDAVPQIYDVLCPS
jgi:hypothetical protein